MNVLIAVLAGVLGLAIGSFLNVVIHRVPTGGSLLAPPSACPACGHPIRWRDNLPVVSWLLLRGRCRDCGEPISARYPLVEAGTGVAFALLALCLAPGSAPDRGWLLEVPEWSSALPLSAADAALVSVAEWLVFVAEAWFLAVGIALTAIDLEHRRLPDVIVLPTIGVLGGLYLAAGVALGFGPGEVTSLWRAAFGGLLLAGGYLLLRAISRGGMGMGDVKLAAAVGLVTGWVGIPALVVGALAAFVLGGLYGIGLLLARRADRRTAVPFGPWMLAGAWVGILGGSPLWTWYRGILGLA